MKKRVLALICAVVVAVSVVMVSVTAFAVPAAVATIGKVVGGIMAVKDTIDTVMEYCDTTVEIYDGLSDFWNGQRLNYEIERVNRLAIWECFIIQGQISESNLREWYSTVLEVAGNVAYYTPPVSDEQMAIVNAYSLVQENVQYGITLDDICAHCYVSGVPTDNPDTGFDESGNVQVSGKTFAEICAQLQEQYAPRADTAYISWKNEKNPNYTKCLSLYSEGTFCNQSDWYEVYLVPFYFDGTKYYYGYYQQHLYQVDNKIVADIYNNIDVIGTGLETYTPTTYTGCDKDLSVYRYFNIEVAPSHISGSNFHQGYAPNFYFSETYSEYLTNQDFYRSCWSGGVLKYGCNVTSDKVDKVCLKETFSDSTKFPYIDGKKDLSTSCDMGYLVSDSFIELTGSIPDPWEMDKIPANYYVTFDGDNIYNYTITDPDTGGSSTVNEYVTNNYTITNNYGSDGDDSGSSGGTTSGDIIVGGNIGVNGNVGVNGQVDVNLNVNVNTGSDGFDGSGGTAELDPYDYEEVNLDEALKQIPEMGDGFTGFLSDVFDFLPSTVLGLIIGGIGLAILCRIAGR